LDQSFRIIAKAGRGVIIYCGGHEGRGIGLVNKIRAYKIQTEDHYNTYEANTKLGFPIDMRSYDAPLAILKTLGITQVELLTNNPLKVSCLQGLVSKVRPLRCAANQHNSKYLADKHDMETKYAFDSNMAKSIMNGSTFEQCESSCSSSPITLAPVVPQTFKRTAAVQSEKVKIAIIRALWNGELVQQISDAVKEELLKLGVAAENISEESVPGAFELPVTAQYIATKRDVDAILCIAILIQLDDEVHFECTAQSVSQGLMQVQLNTNVPVLCGVLACLTEDQALRYADEGVPRSLAMSTLQMAGIKKFTYGEDEGEAAVDERQYDKTSVVAM
jgi:6,7-dimethyl-8-ribityllumazine synthase